MEANGSAQMNSRASSALSDPPHTPEEIARSHTTTSEDDAFRDYPQSKNQDYISPVITHATQAAALDSHNQTDGPTHEHHSNYTRVIQKRPALAATQKSNKRGKKDIWDVDYVTQNPKSPLATALLRSILANPKAFDLLKPDQQNILLKMMPDDDKHLVLGSDGNPRISPEFLKYNPNWSHALSRYQEDLSEGRLDPAWITQARAASEQRQNGEFDDHKDQEYEAFWGTKQKIPNHVIAGMSSAVKLEELFRAKILLEEDTWVFVRKFSGSPSATVIEKEMKVISIKSGLFPTIAIPPGRSKILHSDKGNFVLGDVKGPGMVEKEAIKQYGLESYPNGNAWKSIRVVRRNQDLGSLWDIRQAYHMSKREGGLKDSLEGAKGGRRRTTRAQQDAGYEWIFPFTTVVQQIAKSDDFIQPLQTIPVNPELQAALGDIAGQDCSIFRVDHRVLTPDSIPAPSRPRDSDKFDEDSPNRYKSSKHVERNKQWLLEAAEKGPETFHEYFTRKLDSKTAGHMAMLMLGKLGCAGLTRVQITLFSTRVSWGRTGVDILLMSQDILQLNKNLNLKNFSASNLNIGDMRISMSLHIEWIPLALHHSLT